MRVSLKEPVVKAICQNFLIFLKEKNIFAKYLCLLQKASKIIIRDMGKMSYNL